MTPKAIIKRTILLVGAVFALSLVTTSAVWAAVHARIPPPRMLTGAAATCQALTCTTWI